MRSNRTGNKSKGRVSFTRHIVSSSKSEVMKMAASLHSALSTMLTNELSVDDREGIHMFTNYARSRSLRTVNRSPMGNKTHRDQFVKESWHRRLTVHAPASRMEVRSRVMQLRASASVSAASPLLYDHGVTKVERCWQS